MASMRGLTSSASSLSESVVASHDTSIGDFRIALRSWRREGGERRARVSVRRRHTPAQRHPRAHGQARTREGMRGQARVEHE